MFARLGEEWSVTEEFFGKLEAFVCALYGAKKGTSDVNELWYALSCAKKGEAQSHQLPLCIYCLTLSCAIVQIRTIGRGLQKNGQRTSL